jgi:hypothetical protein
MLLKVGLDKTAFVKFKNSNNFKQNIDKTYSKQPKSYVFKNSGKNPHTTVTIP